MVSLGISDRTIGIHSGKNIDNCKGKGIWRQLQNQLDYLDLKIKMDIIRNATSIQLYLGHAKVNKPQENKAKQKKDRLNKVKKIIKSHFGYKLRRIIYRDCELIEDSKQQLHSLMIFQINLSEK